MKLNKLIYMSLIIASLIGCQRTNNSSNNQSILNSTSEKNYKTDFSIIVPTGAPSIGFLSKLNDEKFDTNTTPNNIVSEMIKGSYDIAVVDLIGGLTAIQMKNAQYKLASIITFGNFYIYSTGNDDNNLIEDSDNIVGFGQGNTPDILFKHLYPNINVDTYLAGVSDVAPIAASGKINNENVDYCIIAEPILYNVLNNKNAPTYGKGSKYSNFQEIWKEKHGNESSILGASVYIKNNTYNNYKDSVDYFLDNLKNEINSYIDNPLYAVETLENYGSSEKQAQKIGINSKIVKGVLENNNSINLGYLSSNDNKFNEIVEEYLTVVKPSIINSDNYL